MNRDKSYVIHQRWLNEKQLIIEFFGLEVGRVQCVTNKSLAPQIGSLYDIQWKENKSGLHRLKQAELSGPIYLLQHNYLISLLYLHELMLALMPVGIVYTQIFKQYSKALKLFLQCGDREVDRAIEVSARHGRENASTPLLRPTLTFRPTARLSSASPAGRWQGAQRHADPHAHRLPHGRD